MEAQVGAERPTEMEKERRRELSFGRAARKATKIAAGAVEKGWEAEVRLSRDGHDRNPYETYWIDLVLNHVGGALKLVWTDTPAPGHLDPTSTGLVRFRGAYVTLDHAGRQRYVGPVLMAKAQKIIAGQDPSNVLAEELAAKVSEDVEGEQ